MSNNSKKLTSVEVDRLLLEQTKIQFVKDNYTIRELLETSMYLYHNDSEFKSKIRNTKIEINK